MRKSTMGFLTRSDTNSDREAGLKLEILDLERSNICVAKTKALISYCKADLHLCCRMLVFT